MKKVQIMIGLHLVLLLLVAIPPMWTNATGTSVTLKTMPVDPLSLFRGHYVTLDYEISQDIADYLVPEAQDEGKLIYITVDDSMPAQLVDASFTKPTLEPGQSCVKARPSWWNNVDIPQIAQYFASRELALELEDIQRGRESSLHAEITTDKNCNAVLNNVVVIDQ